MKKNIHNTQGSILVSTVAVSAVILVTVLNFMYISRIEKQASITSNDSLVAYQRADTGVEKTLDFIYKKAKDDVTSKFNNNVWSSVGNCNSATGLITKEDDNNREYVVQLIKRENETSENFINVDCDNTNTPYSKITRIKVIGIVEGKATRAVEADVPVPVP